MSMERETPMELDAGRYVDGQMEGAERERFEARLAASASLRAEVEVLRQADASLKRAFGEFVPLELDVAGVEGPAARIRAGRVLERRFSWRVRAWALVGAVAAAAVIVLAGLPLLTRTPQGPTGPAGRGMSAERLYALESSRGWAIEHVCASNRAFAEYSRDKVGEALIADPSGVPGVEIVGWAGYDLDLRAAGLDGRASIIVARVDGEPVLMFLDPGGTRNRLLRNGNGDLRVFRREVGSVSVYEVTPLDEPRVMGVFEEAPAALLESGKG